MPPTVKLIPFSFEILVENASGSEADDSSYSSEVEEEDDDESQSIGSQDTEISGSEVQDLRDDAASNMPTPKRAASSKKTKKAPVADVTAGLSALS